jgi:tRNA (adenine37-N6)-methyltransferase
VLNEGFHNCTIVIPHICVVMFKNYPCTEKYLSAVFSLYYMNACDIRIETLFCAGGSYIFPAVIMQIWNNPAVDNINKYSAVAVRGHRMELKPIGIVHTPFRDKADCPIQPRYSGEAAGTVEVFPEYAEGLKDLDTFSHIYLLFGFDRAGEVKLVRPTFLDDNPHGLFSTRHPARPNGIGLSIVRLVRFRGAVLDIEGADMLDSSPLFDIKPYIPQFDCIGDATGGWTEGLDWRPKPLGRE